MKIKYVQEHWKEVKLSDVCDFYMGQAPHSSSYNKEGKGILFIRAGDFGKMYPSSDTYTTEVTTTGKRGDIFLCIVGATSGKINYGIDGCITRSVAALRPKENILQEFLYYNLKSRYSELNRLSSGSAQGILNNTHLEKIKILLPSLKEQKAITEVISTFDDAIQNIDLSIEKTERLKKALMNKFFRENLKTNELVELSSIFEVKTGTTPSTKRKKYWDSATVNWVTPADLGKLDNMFIYESERKISEIALKEVNLNLMPKETIIISTRAPVGHVAILKNESTFNQGCKGLLSKNDEEVNPYYFAYYLSSKKYLLQNRAGQSTFKELSKDMFEKFRVPKINRSKQDHISDVLLTIDKKITFDRKRKEKFDSIKSSVMNNLLSGKKRIIGVAK